MSQSSFFSPYGDFRSYPATGAGQKGGYPQSNGAGFQQPFGGGFPQQPFTGGGPAGFPAGGGPGGFPMGGSGIPSPALQQAVPQAPISQVPGMLPLEQSYIENILRLNKGKLATVYATFENNREWNAKVFKGIIEAAGRDHIILSDPQTGMRFLLLMVYVDYITFDEEIEYEYPYGGMAGTATFPPR